MKEDEARVDSRSFKIIHQNMILYTKLCTKLRNGNLRIGYGLLALGSSVGVDSNSTPH